MSFGAPRGCRPASSFHCATYSTIRQDRLTEPLGETQDGRERYDFRQEQQGPPGGRRRSTSPIRQFDADFHRSTRLERLDG